MGGRKLINGSISRYAYQKILRRRLFHGMSSWYADGGRLASFRITLGKSTEGEQKNKWAPNIKQAIRIEEEEEERKKNSRRQSAFTFSLSWSRLLIIIYYTL